MLFRSGSALGQFNRSGITKVNGARLCLLGDPLYRLRASPSTATLRSPTRLERRGQRTVPCTEWLIEIAQRKHPFRRPRLAQRADLARRCKRKCLARRTADRSSTRQGWGRPVSDGPAEGKRRCCPNLRSVRVGGSTCAVILFIRGNLEPSPLRHLRRTDLHVST